jgi:3'-phosphoadenosine 5'-phosphosulfate sulfotransferase (PAPS reductase)/FAD synthetase
MPQTLDFVQECSERWGVQIHWLEYMRSDDPQLRWRTVNYITASRNGEPFAALIDQKHYLPNPVTRFCTVEMKIRPMKLFIQQILHWAHWDMVIGFRADEMRRVAKLSNPRREPYDRIAPLAEAGITVADVCEFWKQQPFDLRLPNMSGRTMHGNCDLCFLKGAKQILSLIEEDPTRAAWWIAQEEKIKSSATGLGATFRKDRPNYSAMGKMVAKQCSLDIDEDALDDCACTD